MRSAARAVTELEPKIALATRPGTTSATRPNTTRPRARTRAMVRASYSTKGILACAICSWRFERARPSVSDRVICGNATQRPVEPRVRIDRNGCPADHLRLNFFERAVGAFVEHDADLTRADFTPRRAHRLARRTGEFHEAVDASVGPAVDVQRDRAAAARE